MDIPNPSPPLSRFAVLRKRLRPLRRWWRRRIADVQYTSWRLFNRHTPLTLSHPLNGELHTRLEEVRVHASQSRGLFFIFAGVPLDDTGGGSRTAQLVLELLAQGFTVIYLYEFPRWETVELGLDVNLPGLLHLQRKDFACLNTLLLSLPAKPAHALVEIPLPQFIPLLEYLEERGINLIYDLMDDWDSALGGSWYNHRFEQRIARMAEVHISTAPQLAERLQRLSGSPVMLLPNAYNARIFDPQQTWQRPVDLPSAEWIAIYTGALYGGWFDWELLVSAAHAHPQAAFVLVGDYRGQCPYDLPNLHFLGLKAHPDLPAYLAHSDVAIIPWKVNAITRATSPLKVYEYLAMAKPVVAPDLPLLRGIPFITCAGDADSFIQAVDEARHTPPQGADWQNFLRSNTWSKRVEVLLDRLE
jgi:glycosyltransferase involved in cell wall biosynthesis